MNPSPETSLALHARLERALAGVEAPFAWWTWAPLTPTAGIALRRAAGKPIRVASKSLRCRALLRRVLDSSPGFQGVLAFTLPEALWLAGHGFGIPWWRTRPRTRRRCGSSPAAGGRGGGAAWR